MCRRSFTSFPQAATSSSRWTMKRRLSPQKKKPASKRRSNRTARAASSTPSAPAKSSTPLSDVEDYLHRRGDRRRRRRDHIPNKRNPTAAAKLDDDISGSREVQLRIRFPTEPRSGRNLSSTKSA